MENPCSSSGHLFPRFPERPRGHPARRAARLRGAPGRGAAFDHPFIGQFTTVTPVASTVPSNGDLNPYGIVNVPTSLGSLVRGDTPDQQLQQRRKPPGHRHHDRADLPGGTLSVFAQINPAALPGPCPGGVGLTTALAMLPARLRGRREPAHERRHGRHRDRPGCLIVLDSKGTWSRRSPEARSTGRGT